MGPPRCSGPPNRRRRERTLFTKEQLSALEEHFKKDAYPGYRDREDLAASLNLQEHKVQVWFKNRRAKSSRLKRLSQGRGQGPHNDASTDHGVPGDPDPVPASSPAAAVSGPVLPEDPGSCNSSPPSLAGMLPARAPSVSSHGQARWAPAQGAREDFPAAPALAPVWPQDRCAALDFWLDPVVIFDFTDLFPLQDLSHEPPSPLFSEYRKGADSADEDDSGSQQFVNL